MTGLTGYKLTPQAAAAAGHWEINRGIAQRVTGKAAWNLSTGRAGGSDADNFTHNRVTVAEYDDARLGLGAGAIGLAATYACVGLIAGIFGIISPSVYRTGADGIRTEARDHPLFWLLRLDPNYDDDGYIFWETAAASIELHGEFIAERKTRANGDLISLEPLPAQGVQIKRAAGGGKEFSWTDADGKRNVRQQDQMLHIRGFGGNGLRGASTLSVCARAFGGALSTDVAANSLFGKGARPSGVLSTDAKLTGEQRHLLEKLLQEKFIGAMNAGRPMLLDGGLKWDQLSINPADAELLDSRKFSGEEICRIFGVPPAMVGYGDKSSNWGTGKEEDRIGFIQFTMLRRLRRVERALMKQLLTREERQAGVVIEFNLEGLLRGDSAGRSQFYNLMVRLGVMTRNEVRRLENLPPIPGGDVAMVQMQDVPLQDAIAGANQQ